MAVLTDTAETTAPAMTLLDAVVLAVTVAGPTAVALMLGLAVVVPAISPDWIRWPVTEVLAVMLVETLAGPTAVAETVAVAVVVALTVALSDRDAVIEGLAVVVTETATE